MNWRFWTVVIMASASFAVITWDIVVALYSSQLRRDTVSGVSLGWSQQWWGLPFAFGVLGGHLFMPGVWLFPNPWLGGPLITLMAIGLVIIGHQVTPWGQPRWRRAIRAFAILNLGMLSGHLLWPQVGL